MDPAAALDGGVVVEAGEVVLLAGQAAVSPTDGETPEAGLFQRSWEQSSCIRVRWLVVVGGITRRVVWATMTVHGPLSPNDLRSVVADERSHPRSFRSVHGRRPGAGSEDQCTTPGVAVSATRRGAKWDPPPFGRGDGRWSPQRRHGHHINPSSSCRWGIHLLIYSGGWMRVDSSDQ